MTASPEYLRTRRTAIREGTWNPRRTTDPTLTPTPLDFAWGEGTFDWAGTTPRVVASQKVREPLERLLALFGGTIREQIKGRKTPIFVWYAYGARARRVIQGVYPLLSERRREQADRALIGV